MAHGIFVLSSNVNDSFARREMVERTLSKGAGKRASNALPSHLRRDRPSAYQNRLHSLPTLAWQTCLLLMQPSSCVKHHHGSSERREKKAEVLLPVRRDCAVCTAVRLCTLVSIKCKGEHARRVLRVACFTCIYCRVRKHILCCRCDVRMIVDSPSRSRPRAADLLICLCSLSTAVGCRAA